MTITSTFEAQLIERLNDAATEERHLALFDDRSFLAWIGGEWTTTGVPHLAFRFESEDTARVTAAGFLDEHDLCALFRTVSLNQLIDLGGLEIA